jgi:hypothetical protein
MRTMAAINRMKREFIYRDLGEFGFNQFYKFDEGKWTWIDLEVDCDETTLDNFRNDNTLNFQFWVSEDKTHLNIASNFLGHKRQAHIPLSMLTSCKLTFLEPAKEGAVFELTIDSNIYRGEVIRGQMSVKYMGNTKWDSDEFQSKRKILEGITDKLMEITGGQVTKRETYTNA